MTREDVWHAKKIEEIFKSLETSERGLTTDQAEQKLSKYGSNELQGEKAVSKIKENCPCDDKDCPRHGNCEACQEYHHAICSRTNCGK